MSEKIAVYYEVDDTKLQELKQQYNGITFDTPAAYEVGRKAIGVLRDLRTSVEKRRKELKADSLDYGRRVDEVAKYLTGRIKDIEDPLQLGKNAVDEVEARRLAAIEADRQAKIDAEIQARRDAEEARLRALRDADLKRIEEQREKMKAEMAILEEKRLMVEQMRADQEAKLQQERAIRAEEQQRQAKKESDEQMKVLAVEHAKQMEMVREKERQSFADAKQDIQTLEGFAKMLREIKTPTVVSEFAAAITENALSDIDDLAFSIEKNCELIRNANAQK